MEVLLKQYKHTLKLVNYSQERAKRDSREEDRALLSDCATGISWIIEYIELGKEPENRRAITRYAGYQREVLYDPKDAYFIQECALQRKTTVELSRSQKDLLDDLLSLLTNREYEAFLMVRGNGLSYGQTAEVMKVSKGTVQNLVVRAEKKLQFVVRKPSNSEGKFCSIKLAKPFQRVVFMT